MFVAGWWIASLAVAADVDRFAPASSLTRMHGTLQAEAPTVRGGGFSFGTVGAYVAAPVLQDGEPVVDALVPLHLLANWSVSERARVDVMVPVYLETDVGLTGYAGPAMGDVGVAVLFGVAGKDDGPFALGVRPELTLGTATPDALIGRGWAGGVTVALGGQLGPFGWVANGGTMLAENQPIEGEATGLGLAADVVAGTFVRVHENVRLGAEIDAGFGAVSNNARDEQTTAAVQGFVQVSSGQGLSGILGGGTGIVEDVGTARFRLFVGMSWTGWRADRDGDLVIDRFDACPSEAEDLDGFEDEDGCVEIDNDGDTIVDTADTCPDEPEDIDNYADEDGCPEPDNDEDGLLDADDECPVHPGSEAHRGCPDTDDDGLRDQDDTCPEAAGPEAWEGCPDTDDDQLHDGIDACPDVARPSDELLEGSDGCPRRVYVTAQTIRITERIPFPEGRNTLGQSVQKLLDEVAAVLAARPEIVRIEVQGHTDNIGPSSYNRKLSQRRANAVKAYLVGKGVAEERIVARGYGESRPRFTNRTKGGRTQNRRVQFAILERAERPADRTDATSSP